MCRFMKANFLLLVHLAQCNFQLVQAGTVDCNGDEYTKLFPRYSEYLSDIIFDNGHFYLLSTKGRILRSATGSEWKTINDPKDPGFFLSLTRSKNGKFLAGGSSEIYQLDENGQWRNIYENPDYMLWDVVSNGQEFVATAHLSYDSKSEILFYSDSDGATWSKNSFQPSQVLPTSNIGSLISNRKMLNQGMRLLYITAIGDRFFLSDPALHMSLDGRKWQRMEPEGTAFGGGATAWNGKLYVKAGSRIGVSEDGATWTTVFDAFAVHRAIHDVIAIGTGFVAGANCATLFVSDDGISWRTAAVDDKRFPNTPQHLDRFIALASNGTIVIAVGQWSALVEKELSTHPNRSNYRMLAQLSNDSGKTWIDISDTIQAVLARK